MHRGGAPRPGGRRDGVLLAMLAVAGCTAALVPVGVAGAAAPSRGGELVGGVASATVSATTAPRPPVLQPRWAVPVAPRRMVSPPGYAVVDGATVLLPQQLVPIGRLSISPPPRTVTAVVALSVSVTVPQRTAMTLRAWCHPASALPEPVPGPAQPEVLVIGQNAYPGSAPPAVASRTLQGRLPLRLAAGVAVSCEVQASPRTESTTSSWLSVDRGGLSMEPSPVLATTSLRTATVVGTQTTATAAPVTLTDPPAGVTGLADVSLTNCYAGYGLCDPEGHQDSVVDARVVLLQMASGTVCRRVPGPVRRVVVTVLAHHVRIGLPAVTDPQAPCGTSVSAAVELSHVSGNSVEVEALAAPSSMTVTWLQGPAGR